MRRIVQHAVVGLSVSGVAAAVLVGTLGRSDAEPIAAPSELQAPIGATAPIGADREAGLSRATNRPALGSSQSPADQSALEARRIALSVQQSQISKEHQLIVEERKEALAKKKAAEAKKKAAEAKKKAAEAKAKKEAAARKKQIAENGGYDPDTKDPKSIARQIMKNKYNWGSDQFACFNNIIMRESMWVIDATNASSGAYGIPQALPGTKMAKFGSDWRTNPATQILWGLDYLKDRYGTPCGGWSFKSANGWY